MKLFQKREVRRTTVISVGLASLLLGLFSAYHDMAVSALWLAVTPMLGLGVYKFPKLRVVLVIFLGLLIGLWRGSVVYKDLADYQILYG